MQQFRAANGGTLYEDHGYFGRTTESFTIEDAVGENSNGSSGLLELTDTLEKQLEASNLALGDIPADETTELSQAFELDDNGQQLLQDMLQQQAASQGQGQGSAASAASSWEESIHLLQEMLLIQQQQQLQAQQQNLFTVGPKFRRESELLSLLQLPRCASTSLPGQGQASSPASVPPCSNKKMPDLADPHLHNQQMLPLSLPLPLPQPPFRNLLDHKSMLIRPGLLDLEDRDNTSTQEDGPSRLFAGSLFDGKREFNFAKGEVRGINHFATERQRREYLNEKYQTLRSLVPNPSKADRASIVADAIEYVKELKRTVQELQLLVQDKRRGGAKRRKKYTDEEGPADMESSSAQQQPRKGHEHEAYTVGDPATQLRSSWLQRTSQLGTHVDVRIVDDEVNIKVTQRRRRNCLLNVVHILHDLRLDILHANGASIGEHHVFMFNTKIMEGSSTFAGQVATKLLDAVDRHISLSSPTA